jgi:hypothetical protein
VQRRKNYASKKRSRREGLSPELHKLAAALPLHLSPPQYCPEG